MKSKQEKSMIPMSVIVVKMILYDMDLDDVRSEDGEYLDLSA